jgi:hypothetical protein
MADCIVLALVLGMVFFVIMILRLFVRGARGGFGGGKSNYRRIKAWLKEKHGLTFTKDMDPGSIRMQLESVLDRERMRMNADFESRPDYYEAERKKKRWRKRFDVDKRLAGFKAFIEKQDYSVLVE